MVRFAEHVQAWRRLARDLDLVLLVSLMSEIEPEDACGVAAVLPGGRVFVRVGAP